MTARFVAVLAGRAVATPPGADRAEFRLAMLEDTYEVVAGLEFVTPVLALTGQIQQSMIGRNVGLLHELPDQLAIMRGLTKWADRITSPAAAPAGPVTSRRSCVRSKRPARRSRRSTTSSS